MQTDKLSELEKTLRLTKLIRDGDSKTTEMVDSVRVQVQATEEEMKKYSKSIDDMQKELEEIRKLLEIALQKDETSRTSKEL